MRAFRFIGLMLYVGYLVQVGLAMLLIPWSPVWRYLLTLTPPSIATLLDLPAVRGAISGFGAVHLLLVAAELVVASPSHNPGPTQ